MTEHPSAGFGETLRCRREQLGLSLNDVAVRTRVRKTYLQALEEENLRTLPGAAYAVGFLRIYAGHLDLDAEPLVAALTGKAVPNEELTEKMRNAAVQRGKARGGKPRRGNNGWLLLLFVALVLLGGGSLLYLQNPADAPPPVPVPVVPLSPPVELAPPLPSPSPSLSPPSGSESANVPAPEMVVLPVLPPEGAIVRIVAVSAGVIKVSLDGQESRSYELMPEQQLNWKVGSQLQMELSAPALIRCWVDEQELPLAELVAVSLVPHRQL